jgi:hypothetical protein
MNRVLAKILLKDLEVSRRISTLYSGIFQILMLETKIQMVLEFPSLITFMNFKVEIVSLFQREESILSNNK